MTHENPEPGYSGDAADIARLAPLITDLAGPAYNALTNYADRIKQSPRIIAHPLRVTAMLHDFAGTHGLSLPPYAYDASVLHDVGQRFDDYIFGRNARPALKEFSTDPDVTVRTWEAVSTLLAEAGVVEEYSETIRSEARTKSPDLHHMLTTKDSSREVPVWMWNARGWMTSPARMLELFDNANLEIILTKAVEAFDNLRYPAPRESAVLQDVFDAEAFYAPMCEIMAYDGIGMGLLNLTALTRLQRSGNGAFVNAAREMLTPLQDRTYVARCIGSIFSKLIGGDSMVEHVVDDHAEHGIILGEALLQANASGGSSDTLRAVWRRKTEGRVAAKLASGRPVPDVIGITIVTPDDYGKMAELYRRVTTNVVEALGDGSLMESGEDEPFDVRGDSTFLEKIVHDMQGGALDPSRITPTVTSNDYEVAKMTFQMPTMNEGERVILPVEIQIQTETGRLRSRRGKASHAVRSAGESPGGADEFDISVLRAIHERKRRLVEQPRGGLVDGSIEHGTQLREAVKRSRGYPQTNLAQSARVAKRINKNKQL